MKRFWWTPWKNGTASDKTGEEPVYFTKGFSCFGQCIRYGYGTSHWCTLRRNDHTRFMARPDLLNGEVKVMCVKFPEEYHHSVPSEKSWPAFLHTLKQRMVALFNVCVSFFANWATICYLPLKLVWVWAYTCALQRTNMSPTKAPLNMIFVFPRWDMLVPWDHHMCFPQNADWSF